MLKMTLNQAILELDLSPRAGFLVKSGDKGSNLLHPEHSDLGPLRTRVRRGPDGAIEDTVFIPGSTLKGVFRSAGERALRSLDDRYACDPHHKDTPCQRGPRERDASTADRHKALCLACRLFGSQQAAGRIQFSDALPPLGNDKAWAAANRTSTRSGVSIDRLTGGPARGKLFEAEIVTAGTFRALLSLDNVQLWQLGLLGLLVEDLDAGELRIGSGRTRGLGAFTVKVKRLDYWQVGAHPAPLGVGALRPDLAGPYGWLAEPSLTGLPEGTPHRAGRRWRWETDAEARAALSSVVATAWPPERALGAA